MTNYVLDGGAPFYLGFDADTSTQDLAAFAVINGCDATLQLLTVAKSGDTSSIPASLGVGQNAGLLVTTGSAAFGTTVSVSTTGLGSAGLFATGTETSINLMGVQVTTSGDDSTGAAASAGGSLILHGSGLPDISTAGMQSDGIDVVDQASSAQTLGLNVVTNGLLSAAIEADGSLVDNGSNFTANNAAGLLEHENGNVTLNNSTVTGSTGVLIDQSGTNAAGIAQLQLSNALLTATDGDAFDVTGSRSFIQVQQGMVTDTSGILLSATAGASVTMFLTSITTAGTVQEDDTSSVALDLGSANDTGAATVDSLSVDPTSIWTSTGTSTVSQLLTNPTITAGALVTGYAAVAGGVLTVGTATGTIVTLAGGTETLNIAAGNVQIDSGGADDIQLDTGSDTVFASGSTQVGNATGSLMFVTGAAAATLQAGAGSDTVFAGAGGGRFTGGAAGHNVLAASTGNTTLIGAVGGDIAYGGASGSDVLAAGSGAETLVAGGGADTLFGGTGSDTLYGGTGGDTVILGSGTNTLVDAGADTVFAGAGATTVFGATSGPDAIVAGSGSLVAMLRDGGTVFAGRGNDTVFAGLAHDVFVATNGAAGGHELIDNFKNGTDTILLSGYAPSGITQTVTDGNTVLTLSDHTTITLVGITSLSPLSLHG